jgi:hypothetical protein
MVETTPTSQFCKANMQVEMPTQVPTMLPPQVMSIALRRRRAASVGRQRPSTVISGM